MHLILTGVICYFMLSLQSLLRVATTMKTDHTGKKMVVNMKTGVHGSQSSRKLKMAPVRLKDGNHFGSRTFQVNKIVFISPFIDLAIRYVQENMTKIVCIQHCTYERDEIACHM